MAQPDGDPAARRRHAPDDAEIAELLRAGASAPSSHISQPWRLRWQDDAVEVHGVPDRRLEAADPDARELRIACGAAIANVRLTTRAQGRRAHTQLMPVSDDPWFYGRVRPGSPWPPAGWEVELARAVRRRHTDRHPFADRPLSAGLRDQLLRAARRESCRLVIVEGRALRRALLALTAEAHHEQQRDPAFVAEWARWVGSGSRSGDGVPPEPARRAPRTDDAWGPRDFGGGVARHDRGVGAEEPTEHEPTIAVVTSFDDGPLAQVRAGLAMQQVLLTATARGLAASFVAPPLEVAAVRVRVRALLGNVLWPQVVPGWGGDARCTRRRATLGAGEGRGGGRPVRGAGRRRGDVVAFEADHVDPDSRTGWSVMVIGSGGVVNEIERLVAVIDHRYRPWVRGRGLHVIPIDASASRAAVSSSTRGRTRGDAEAAGRDAGPGREGRAAPGT